MDRRGFLHGFTLGAIGGFAALATEHSINAVIRAVDKQVSKCVLPPKIGHQLENVK